MSTVDELVDQALARTLDSGQVVPTTRSLLYRRLGVRQQELFGMAARENPEYFGACAVGTLDATGGLDLQQLGDPAAPDPVEAIELIARIEIVDPGVSSYTAGDDVHVVASTDRLDASFPPRVLIRGGALSQVGTDLADVVSLRVHYSRKPFRVGPGGGATVVVLPEPYDELLVIDLTRWVLQKATSVPQDVRGVALAALKVEEEALLQSFLLHVRGFTSVVERSRFVRIQGGPR